jgi:hypothetical protein
MDSQTTAEANEMLRRNMQAIQDSKKGHFLIYGDSGSGKSTSAATFPTPQLVLSFDPYGKEMPYKKQHLTDGRRIETVDNAQGIPVEYILTKDNAVVCQIEHYIDTDPRQPDVYSKFMTRMDRFKEEYDDWKDGSLVLDSVTFMELAARKWAQYRLNPSTKEPRQWFASSTDMLEEMLMLRFGSLKMHVVVLAHVDEDKDEVNGEIIRNPSAPGRMRKRSPAGFSELYRMFVLRDEQGNRLHKWMTRNDGRWNCSTQFASTPDPCEPRYEALGLRT